MRSINLPSRWLPNGRVNNLAVEVTQHCLTSLDHINQFKKHMKIYFIYLHTMPSLTTTLTTWQRTVQLLSLDGGLQHFKRKEWPMWQRQVKQDKLTQTPLNRQPWSPVFGCTSSIPAFLPRSSIFLPTSPSSKAPLNYQPIPLIKWEKNHCKGAEVQEK